MILFIISFISFVNSAWGSCSTDFENVGDQCILFNLEKRVTWTEAEWFCRWNGAQLHQLKDKDSQEQILDLLSLRGIKKDYWVGGFVHSDSKWHWIDDSKQPNETQLAANE